MAVSANAVFEIQNGGSDTNGGGFVTGSGGVDYSQQTAAQLSVSDAACVGNTTITSVTGGFTSAMVGSIIYLSSGPGWYQITARTNTNTVTIDRSGPTATGMTANVGGALATTGGMGQVMESIKTDGSLFLSYLKYSATPYPVTTTSANVTSGVMSGAYPWGLRLIGYDTTRTATNTDANRPTIKADAALGACTLLSISAYYTPNEFRNIVVDGTSRSGVNGVSAFTDGGYGKAVRCAAHHCVVGISANEAFFCYSHDNSSYGFQNVGYAFGCVAASNGSAGFYGGGFTVFSLSYSNTGRGFDQTTGFVNCTAYGNGGDGFKSAFATRNAIMANLISYSNTGYGYVADGLNEGVYWTNLASGNNTSGDQSGLQLLDTVVSLSAAPFTNAAGGDFSLNTTAGGGAACRAAGFPGVLPGGLTTGYLDVGAAQHQDSGGAAGMLFVPDLAGL